jgi:predicted nucleic acid-binding protein
VTVLVDSDILIEVSRAKNENILSRWMELSQSDNPILYSPVSAAELWAGARPQEDGTLTNLFRALLCAPIDRETGQQAGDYLRQYHKSHGLELGDALIASAAVLNHAELWTRNRKHYPMKELSFYIRRTAELPKRTRAAHHPA